MSETEDPRLPDKHRSSEPKDIDNEQDIQSTLSAVQSNDAIKFIKGRIIATNRLLRTLETAKKESSEDKARIASLVEEVAALNQSKLELEKELTTARIDLGRLRETSINVESQLSARVQEVEAQLKKSTDRERQVEPVKQNNGKEDFLVVQLKARVDDLQEQLKESEQKIRKRANAAAKSKDEEIARLKQELAKKESEAKRAGDEFMEIEVKNMMLESDLTEAKEDLEAAHSELNTLREEMRVLKEHENITNDQNDNNTHEALVAAHREITVLRNELGHRYQENKKLAAKLAKNEDHLSKRDAMETDNDVNNANGQVLHLRSKDRRSVTPAGQGQQHLMNELRRLMEENAKLHKQKRVLQEKLTEQLVINAESQAASLSFPSSSPSYLVSEGRRISYDNDYDKSFDAGSVDFPASVSDISRTSSRFEENGPKYAVCDKTLKQQLHTTLPVTSSRPQTARSSPTPSPCSPLLQSNPPPAFKRSLSIDTNPSTSSASSSSALPAVSSPATQTTPSTGVPTTASTNTLTKTSSAAAMNASTKALLRDQSMVVPESSVTVPSSSKMTRKARPSKLEKFAKARLPSSMASLSRKRTTPTPEKASSASEKRTTKRVKMTPIPESESKIVPNTDTVTCSAQGTYRRICKRNARLYFPAFR
ncbi:uncharacterized protein BYT42DRAFT_174573 [Radiomyces spectabilis]|uniref:uncharacterized protein n=1 Tax=Radiomyces spectabilis TaxID=64574 RepID=UPI002220767E|nr:uncharacterized protein BYT42DRAFT_174573 [Radiomyces spectabilis]KAI8390917.1 hypothetical protein BYT42DRAFT_174573 [Radiomyces spectabilis]